MEDKWAKLEEIVRKVVREELSTTKKEKPEIRIESGKWIGLAEEQIKTWKTAYPAVDVDKELREMVAWLTSNPNDAPRSKFMAFINAWLKKHQDRHAIRSIPTVPRPTAITPSLCEYCRKPSTGAVGGRRACDEHFSDAMNGTKPQHYMPGIVAKPVAGS